MEDDKAVVAVVVVGYAMAKIGPSRRRHIAGVDGRLKLVGVNLNVELSQLGHVLYQVLEVERFECSGQRIAVHADSATGINEEYF